MRAGRRKQLFAPVSRSVILPTPQSSTLRIQSSTDFSTRQEPLHVEEEEDLLAPSVLFSQNVLFDYDGDQIQGDPNLRRFNEIRKKRKQEQFIKENPFTQHINMNDNGLFQNLAGWLNKEVKHIKRKEERRTQDS